MTFPLTITTVDTKIFKRDIISVTAPASEGEVTILARHAPFVAVLKKGVIRVRQEKDTEPLLFDIEKGILEVGGNHATILM